VKQAGTCLPNCGLGPRRQWARAPVARSLHESNAPLDADEFGIVAQEVEQMHHQ
jgi:hypothetical protein